MPPAGGPEQQWDAGWPWFFLWRQQPVQQHWEHDDHCFNQSLFVWKAGGGESGGKAALRTDRSWGLKSQPEDLTILCVCVCVADRVRPFGGRKVCLQNPPFSNVWIHDQLYPQTETPTWKVHDEQRSWKLHYPPGNRNLSDLFCLLWLIYGNVFDFMLINIYLYN